MATIELVPMTSTAGTTVYVNPALVMSVTSPKPDHTIVRMAGSEKEIAVAEPLDDVVAKLTGKGGGVSMHFVG
jgi:hypothetical protein